jgi:hypothetical protein
LNGSQERRAVAGATRFRMAQQLRDCNLLREISPNQLDQPRRNAAKSFRIGGVLRAMYRVADLRNRTGEDRSAQRFAERTNVAVGYEVRELQRRFVECTRHVEPFEYRLERTFVGQHLTRRGNDEPEHIATPERYADDVPNLQRQIAGVVGER